LFYLFFYQLVVFQYHSFSWFLDFHFPDSATEEISVTHVILSILKRTPLRCYSKQFSPLLLQFFHSKITLTSTFVHQNVHLWECLCLCVSLIALCFARKALKWQLELQGTRGVSWFSS
jgi:hypothetical protein